MTSTTLASPDSPMASPDAGERDWRAAVGRGLRCRCPACGQGKLFRGFLTPAAACEACGEDLTPQRSDDLPPYIVITLVGHVVVGGMLLAERFADWSMTMHALVWVSLTLILALGLMRPVKGGVIGLQWALRMHGFGRTAGQDSGRIDGTGA
jgi:uncharacterized protein (DUF983 family)